VEAPATCDIREIRPDEAAAALALLDGAPTADTLARRLSVGAFDAADGTLRGVAVHESLSPRGCAVHLHCDDPGLGRTLLDRALSKAAAAGRRASRVTLHPEPTACAVWTESAWPVRPAARPAGDAVQARAGHHARADPAPAPPEEETAYAA